ncbi:O-antigen ligase family protein [Draconibacterium aestuarii]
MGIARNTGIFWEPGVFQLIANLYLFFTIKFHKKLLETMMAGLAVLTSFSTIGLIILILNFLYFLYIKIKEHKFRIHLVAPIVIAFILIFPLIKGNALQKMDGHNTSGLIRYRDFLIGIELIKERPLAGHGYITSNYLNSKTYVTNIQHDLFTDEFISTSGYMGGGYTNGLLSLFILYGIPLGILILFSLFKNTFIGSSTIERIIFFLIVTLSLISEPISSTSFFFLFPLSTIILKISNH